jgi:radical SAM protein with 4Fe4S-binding SPASM domain
MNILYDIDLDFFLDSERSLAECFEPKRFVLSPGELLSHCAGAPYALHVEHAEALAAWDKESLRDWECWHFDAHHDLGANDACFQLMLPPGRRADHINSGNFLFHALREGIISRLHWIYPDWLPFSEEYLPQGFPSAMRERIVCRPWSEVARALPAPQRVDISFSPAFTPLESLRFLADFLPVGEDDLDWFMERLLRERNRALLGMPPEPLWLPDVRTSPLGLDLYHGSPLPELNTLRGFPLYLSPSPAVACCFGLPLADDGGWIHGVDHLGAAMPVTYLAVPSEKADFLETSMTLYSVRGTKSCCPAGMLHGYEYSTDEPCLVRESRFYPSVRDALEEHGVQVGLRGEIRMPPDLTARARQRQNEVEAFLEMPLDAILCLPALEASLAIFLSGLPDAPPGGFDSTSPCFWRNYLFRVLLPLCAPLHFLPKNRFHGLEHSIFTARMAALLACRKCRPLAPMLAACLHDAARKDDSPGTQHARDSAKLSALFLQASSSRLPELSEKEREKIVDAVARHADPAKSASDTGACLQDADRLRLAWEEGVRPEFFSTAGGLALARDGAQAAQNLLTFHENLGHPIDAPLEIKLEVTAACNLACSFCHQGYGYKTDERKMNFADYSRRIKAIAGEGILDVRLTGGEPLLIPDLAEYLAVAKAHGLRITLNSNAVLWEEANLLSLLPYLDCLKISFPAPDENGNAECTGTPGAWERKIEAAAIAATHYVRVEFLTPMFPKAIAAFERFAALLEDMSFVRWLPLRAEPAPGNNRPVNREEMLRLVGCIAELRQETRWEDLMLYLATPFCLMDSCREAVTLLHGRQSCGPFNSLCIDPDGKVIRCYSRRTKMDIACGLRATAMRAAFRDFQNLPHLCRRCPVAYRCLGGCRCGQALVQGGFDYLARPERAELWQNNARECGLQ